MAEIPYPLPTHLVGDIEYLLRNVPDRGDTVFNLRRRFGYVYALGYSDGRRAGSEEAQADRLYEDTYRARATSSPEETPRR
jgi:hypothetical protein